MTDAARYAPSEIELELPFGTFMFRLPPVRIARVQEARGMKVQYPDGGVATRPKAIGAIVREHLAGVLGNDLRALDVDDFMGEHDSADSREVIVQGLIGGGTPEAEARRLVIDHVDPWPENERWKLATSILVACVRGYVPPTPPGDEADVGNADAPPGTSSSTSAAPSETSPSSDRASTDS